MFKLSYGDITVILLSLTLFTISIIDPLYSEWIAILLIIITGIPHGSFDLRIAQRKWEFLRSRPLLTILLYITTGLLMSLFCILSPFVALITFLIVSAVHFADGERISNKFKTVSAAVIGISAILLPILLHFAEAQKYMDFFTPNDSVALTPTMAKSCGLALSFIFLLTVILNITKQNRSEFLQLIICLLGWHLLSPLAGFSIWFLGRHSRHHFEECIRLFKLLTSREDTPRTIPWDFIAISITAILLILPLSIIFDLTKITELFSASIILIAGLTLPHVLVTFNLRR